MTGAIFQRSEEGKVKKRLFAVIIIVSLISACGGREQVTSTPALTRVARATHTPETAVPPTETPAPTATDVLPVPTVPPTATLTPEPAPTSTPAPTATPTPSNVMGLPDGMDANVRTYGGGRNDYLYDILLLADGGTLLAGQANNTGLSPRITPGNAHLIRTDAEGNIIWEKEYGGEDDAMFYSLVQAGEDEYVVLGQIAASYAREETDMYLVKIDGEGNEIWSHTYGGRGMDHSKMVRQTADGGYILTGSRADEYPTGNQYEADIVLIKTDAEGNEAWTRTYGDTILESAWGVEQTSDGGYVLIGYEAKTHDDRDVLAIKTNETGEVEWSRTWDLDPGDRDGGNDLILTADGQIVIDCIQSMDSGLRGAVLIKVDLDGNEIWTKHFGEEGVGNEFWDIMEDSDGGYVMAGDTIQGKVPTTGEDIRHGLVIKTDPDGEILWQHVFSTEAYEQLMFSSAVVLPDGGYIFVGRATRKGERYADMLWLKLTTDGTPVPSAKTDTPVLDAISVETVDQVELLHTLSGHRDKVLTLAFSGDGVYLASSSQDETIKLWDLESGQDVHTFSINEVVKNSIAFSPDGSLLASADAIWDVESKQVVHALEQDRYVPALVAFSHDGSLLAVALGNQPIKLWDVATGQVVHTFEEQADNVARSIGFSPDDALLAEGGNGGTVRLWDVENGHMASTLEHGNDSHIHDVAFSPDGSVLASGGTDYTVRLWDVASGQAVHTLRHHDCLYSVAFSPDSTILAAAGCERSVRLWDVKSGRLLRTLPHDDELMAVAFSPDGTLLASGGYDNQIYLWAVSR